MTDVEILTRLAERYQAPLAFDSNSIEGQRHYIEWFNARSGFLKLCLREGLEGMTVVSLAQKKAERAERLRKRGRHEPPPACA
jgi:hypothetical protein